MWNICRKKKLIHYRFKSLKLWAIIKLTNGSVAQHSFHLISFFFFTRPVVMVREACGASQNNCSSPFPVPAGAFLQLWGRHHHLPQISFSPSPACRSLAKDWQWSAPWAAEDPKGPEDPEEPKGPEDPQDPVDLDGPKGPKDPKDPKDRGSFSSCPSPARVPQASVGQRVGARAGSYLGAPVGSGRGPWQCPHRAPSSGRFICLLRPPHAALAGGSRFSVARGRVPVALGSAPSRSVRVGERWSPHPSGFPLPPPSASCPRAEFVSPLALRSVLPPRCFTLHP